MSTVITQQEAAPMVKRLENLGCRLEVNTPSSPYSPDWFIVAKAAAMLESLRLGLSAIEPPIWIGVDMAAPGAEQTVRSIFHA